MALICGLAIPAGAATSADSAFDQQIFQADACEKPVNPMAKIGGVITRTVAVKADVQESDLLAATTAPSKPGSIVVVDNALLVSVHGNAMVQNGRRNTGNEQTFNKTNVASVNHSFNNSTGVANINVAAGNLNIQSISYSGPDLSSGGLLATGGSVKPAATGK
jgi:hypothetical protein